MQCYTCKYLATDDFIIGRCLKNLKMNDSCTAYEAFLISEREELVKRIQENALQGVVEAEKKLDSLRKGEKNG